LEKDFTLGQLVVMKKPHPCGSNEWKIIRLGMDIRIKCLNCGRSVLIPRGKFERRVKEIKVQAPLVPKGEG
jgi:hypothetical protein